MLRSKKTANKLMSIGNVTVRAPSQKPPSRSHRSQSNTRPRPGTKHRPTEAGLLAWTGYCANRTRHTPLNAPCVSPSKTCQTHAGGIPLALMGSETGILSTSVVDMPNQYYRPRQQIRSSADERSPNPENPTASNFLLLQLESGAGGTQLRQIRTQHKKT